MLLLRKHRIPLIIFLVLSSFLYGQVGIGTTNPHPSSVLDVNSNSSGLLLPRLTSAERNAIVDPANGLIVYNSDSDEIQMNTNTEVAPNWEALTFSAAATSGPNQSVKYSNTNVTTNINNAAGIDLPIFGALSWNDNTTLFDVPNATSVVIAESGRYEIVVNVSMVTTTTNARQSPEIRIEIDNVPRGSYGSTGYIRRNGGHEESSLHIREVFELPAGATISINVQRAAGAGTTIMRGVDASNIYISKLL